MSLYEEYEDVIYDAIEYGESEDIVLEMIRLCPSEHQDDLLYFATKHLPIDDGRIYHRNPLFSKDYWINVIGRLISKYQ